MKKFSLIVLVLAAIQVHAEADPEKTQQKSYEMLDEASRRLQDIGPAAKENVDSIEKTIEEKQTRARQLQHMIVKLNTALQRKRQSSMNQPKLREEIELIYAQRIVAAQEELQVLNERLARLQAQKSLEELHVETAELFEEIPDDDENLSSQWEREYLQITQERYQKGGALVGPYHGTHR